MCSNLKKIYPINGVCDSAALTNEISAQNVKKEQDEYL
jgi:hypothetical protein